MYKSSDLSGVYEEMAEVLGLETTLKIYDYYQGLNVFFPSRLLKKEYVMNALKKDYDGTNLKVLSRKYGYTERWLRAMLKTLKENGAFNEY